MKCELGDSMRVKPVLKQLFLSCHNSSRAEKKVNRRREKQECLCVSSVYVLGEVGANVIHGHRDIEQGRETECVTYTVH